MFSNFNKFKGNDLLLKYKKTLFEFSSNVISFSILIIVQQIIALPIISRFYSAETFGKIIIAIGISNIVTSMFGFSIGNARLLDKKFYSTIYLKLLKITNLLIILISAVVYIVMFSNNSMELVMFAAICLLGNIRNFYISEYRIKNDHNWIFRQNLFYFLGSIMGIIVFNVQQNWLLIFLIAEAISVLLCYLFFFQRYHIFKLFKEDNELSITNTFQLMINNGISYSLSLYDRFIIYPILGPNNVSIYYSTSVTTRIGALIMNPLSNFILGKLATEKVSSTKRIILFTNLLSIFITIIYFFLILISTPILVEILYPSFLEEIKPIIIPICIGAALMGGVNVLKPVHMKFIGVKHFNKLFVAYGLGLIFLSIILCAKYGLIGVAIASVISNAMLYIWVLFSLKKISASKLC